MSIKYTKELLNNYCQENNVKLIKDYSNEKIWCEMSLEGKCSNTDCVNTFKKLFKNLIKYGSFCIQCNKSKKQNCIIFNWKLLQSYCSEKNIKLDKDYSKEKLSVDTRIIGTCENTECENNFDRKFRNLVQFGALCNGCFYKKRTDITKKSNKEKYGVEFVSQVPEIRQKAKNTTMERYGVEYATQSDIVQEKTIKTNLKKYGVERASKSKEVQNKTKETCLEKYGVENYFQSNDKKIKSINTCLEKYGVENPSQNENIKIKKEDTCIKNYGVKCPFQMEETKQKNRLVMIENKDDIMEKRRKTCLEKYGVEHHTQNSEIMEKQSKNAYKLKEYTLPSGNIIKFQGYENYALDEILQDGILEEDIINGCKNVPEIWYEDKNGIKHRHYVDIFIPSQNRCIEVKSTWTAEKKKDCIFLKQKSGKELGYLYEIWVYDNKGKKVECYK